MQALGQWLQDKRFTVHVNQHQTTPICSAIKRELRTTKWRILGYKMATPQFTIIETIMNEMK